MLKIIPALNQYSDNALFWGFAFCVIVLSGTAIGFNSPYPILVPALLLFVLFSFNNPRHLFYLFFFLLPFSMELQLPSGLGTDLPSEPIMVFLFAICILFFIRSTKNISRWILIHPVSLIIIIHLGWILFTAFFSANFIVSIKFFLAKTWYVFPFYFLPLILFKSEKEIRKIFIFLSIGLFIAVTYVFIRHSLNGFAFHQINEAVKPIFRNHVNYSVMLVAFIPYMWYLVKSSTLKNKIFLYSLFLFLLVAIYFTYTRAAQLSIVLSLAIYWVIRWRLLKYALALSLVGIIGLSTYLSYNNKYLEFAPNYERAIAHDKFDNLLEATYKMEDISTVERFYRWVAGFYMVKEKPFTGYGPSTFYSQYSAHTVTSYKTYVSDNPEKSGIHNNYLMVAAEQGLPGLAIMLLLAFLPLIYAEKAYHLLKKSSEKLLVMAAAICFALIDIIILINDLLEADKVGPFYFLSAAIIVFFYNFTQKKKSQ